MFSFRNYVKSSPVDSTFGALFGARLISPTPSIELYVCTLSGGSCAGISTECQSSQMMGYDLVQRNDRRVGKEILKQVLSIIFSTLLCISHCNYNMFSMRYNLHNLERARSCGLRIWIVQQSNICE